MSQTQSRVAIGRQVIEPVTQVYLASYSPYTVRLIQGDTREIDLMPTSQNSVKSRNRAATTWRLAIAFLRVVKLGCCLRQSTRLLA